MSKLLLYLIFTFCCFFQLEAQKEYVLVYKTEAYQQFIKHPQTHFKDSLRAHNYLYELSRSAKNKGYLLANIDSLVYLDSNKVDVYFYLGDQFEFADIRMDKQELDFVKNHEHINEKFLSHLDFTPREFQNSLIKIRNAYLNNGYPFVSIQLSDPQIEEHKLRANLSVVRGPFVRWKAIHIKGDTSVAPKFVSSLINIKVGDVYDEALLQEISIKVEQIPFLQEIKVHELLFTKEGCELFLYLKSIPLSSFNGIVGLQPDPIADKINITGELNLRLLNTLKRGELLDIKWQSIRDQTQSLNSHLNIPFLFKTPFGIDGSFDLYKRDTSFLELNSRIGIQYFLNRGNYVKAFYENISSSILSGGENNPSFTRLGNTRSNSYGLAYVGQRVDYLPNPTRGFNMHLEASAGSRTSQVNDTTIAVKSLIYRGVAELEWFIPLYKRHVLRLSNYTEFYSADEIFENEVYRFGGLNEQRGFNEDELLATTRNTSTIEYRFLLDRNSHVFAFGDITWYENNTTSYYNDQPIGFGLGFSFRTNLGVFSISYALGKQFDNPVLLSDSKVHFGYIAYF